MYTEKNGIQHEERAQITKNAKNYQQIHIKHSHSLHEPNFLLLAAGMHRLVEPDTDLIQWIKCLRAINT